MQHNDAYRYDPGGFRMENSIFNDPQNRYLQPSSPSVMIGNVFMNLLEISYIIIILMNIVTFFVYCADKRKARRGEWRISEGTLLLLAFCGGGTGAFLAMQLFHHKTKKWKFRVLVPLFMVIQIILIVGAVICMR